MRKSERAKTAGRAAGLLACVVVALCCLPVPSLRAAEPGPLEEKKAEPAKISVSGLTWWRNRELRLTLERLLGGERGPTLDAGAIEDAALILLSTLGEQGFRKPVVEVAAMLEGGTTERFTIDAAMEATLPRPLAAREVDFRLRPGVRSYVGEVSIEGLQALSADRAKALFRPETEILTTKAARAYSPGRLRRGLGNLQEELRQRGYAEAEVRALDVQTNDETGEVKLRIEVTEGPLWRLSGVSIERNGAEEVVLPSMEPWTGKPWAPPVEQNISQQIRQTYYRAGYPDVRVNVSPRPEPVRGGERTVLMMTRIEPGPAIKVGAVRFEGNAHTRESVLRRRVRAREGEPLNPLGLERARYRIARLGVFDAVDLRYDTAGQGERDPVFILREGPRWESSLLFGYGSYEQFRGGIEARQMNIFGRGHQARLELVQSIKSSRGDYTYTVPELFGESLDGTAKLFGLRRQERAFDREEYGATLTLKRPLPWIRADATVGYTYQALLNDDNQLATRTEDIEQVTVASLDFALARDRRDNPLRPRRGYRWFTQAEIAAKEFGGEVNYQRFEVGGSYHTGWGRNRWIHVGLVHGVITTLGTTDESLPVNKRYFPGGDSSIRGYSEGEAAPRELDGRYIGAKSYLLLNLELEQALTANWSVVVFADALGQAAQLADYPFDEKLYTVGLGVRYQTIIGPIRAEYGYNLNPRVDDPRGTLHISVGFPF